MSDRSDYVTITHGMRGFFYVHVTWSQLDCGTYFPEPYQSGCGSYYSADEAEPAGRSYAEAMGLEFVPYEAPERTVDEVIAVSEERRVIMLQGAELVKRLRQAHGLGLGEAMRRSHALGYSISDASRIARQRVAERTQAPVLLLTAA